jgi:hypothetical protein
VSNDVPFRSDINAIKLRGNRASNGRRKPGESVCADFETNRFCKISSLFEVFILIQKLGKNIHKHTLLQAIDAARKLVSSGVSMVQGQLKYTRSVIQILADTHYFVSSD